jgi:hypothetical protein
MAQIKAPVAGNSQPIAKAGNTKARLSVNSFRYLNEIEQEHFGRRVAIHDSFRGPII